MIGGILLLGIAIFGLMVLFGQGKPENYYKFLIWLIFAPLLLAIGYRHALWFWFGLPLWIQVLSFLLVPFLIGAIFRLLFPKAKWLQAIQAVAFQTLIYAVTFPVRFLWRAGGFFFRRERRQVQRLNPYRPVVGGRPPLQNERREVHQRENIFD